MDNEDMLIKLSKPMREAVEKIIKRCEKGGIEYEWSDFGLDMGYSLIIRIQAGRNKRPVVVGDLESAESLLDLNFEKYVFVEGYLEAICCYEEGWVETIVDGIGPLISKVWILSKLAGRPAQEVEEDIGAGKVVRLELNGGSNEGIRVLIGEPSKAMLGLLKYVTKGRDMSFRVEGLQITNNREAAEKLRRMSNSVFFELKKKLNIGLFANRYYEVETSTWRMNRRARERRESKVGLPRYEYDEEPIELYWLGVSAYRMPLLQYLAYYQILEFYFMTYCMSGAKREIRNCLKDPQFDADDEGDMERIVRCVLGQAGPDLIEKEMLCNTIKGCVSKEEVVSEMSGEPLKEYFKKEYKVVSLYKVSEENKDQEIREQLAERIYNIRCRIVHTKEDDKRGRIRPFTKEEMLLQKFDLPVIENLAEKVLIANSKRVSFG